MTDLRTTKKRVSKRAKTASPVTSHLDAAFAKAKYRAIASEMRSHLRHWGAHGWRIVGPPSRLRLEVTIPMTVAGPAEPVRPIVVAGRTIKPRIHASHAFVRRTLRATAGDFGDEDFTHALAPGARVRVGRRDNQEFVGIAAVLVVDGEAKVLTCGHPAAFAFGDEVLAGDEPDGEAIARLERNFLEDDEPLDGALCAVTDAGHEVLSGSAGAPTWRFRTIKAPSADDNDKEAVFWQTHDGEDEAQTATITSFNGEDDVLFGPRGPHGPFVETTHAVVGGDSGSLLSLGASLYGLCSGFVGNTALFTPIAAIVARLKKEAKKCSVYHPSGSAPL